MNHGTCLNFDNIWRVIKGEIAAFSSQPLNIYTKLQEQTRKILS